MMGRNMVPVAAHEHHLGPEAAPLTLVEYGDYECPYCGRAYPIVKAVRARFGARLRFVFRNYPLEEMHPHARLAAEAAEAAGAQDRFWPMHDALFEDQGALDIDALTARAEAIGLDVRRFLDVYERSAYGVINFLIHRALARQGPKSGAAGR